MTTYVLPANSEIGTTLYYNGDLVWWNGIQWIPVVTGSTKLNEVASEVIADEAILVSDESRISSLEDRVTFLETQVDALKEAIDTIAKDSNLLF
jgi:peptidoglycan hydrolase CwlO-like protein